MTALRSPADPTIGPGLGEVPAPRLLLVDDQALNIAALARLFQPGCEVLSATSGEQALALCAAHPIDLVLLDVMMPGMDGLEVCRRLKADPATRDVPVIFVTAQTDPQSETRGLGAGAVDFISKPISPAIVRARVKTHLTLKAQSDQLRQWAYVDGLTGVCNRRYFDERLISEWRRATRSGAALGVVLLDVDAFKPYNDRYGHQAGDDCLREVARIFRGGIHRPGDLIARYGGEEFVCLLPDTGHAGAMHIAQVLRQAIAGARIEHAGSPTAPYVTVSAGVCSAQPSAQHCAQAMVVTADQQLYLAKSTGRNRVCGAELAEAADPASPVPTPRR